MVSLAAAKNDSDVGSLKCFGSHRPGNKAPSLARADERAQIAMVSAKKESSAR